MDELMTIYLHRIDQADVAAKAYADALTPGTPMETVMLLQAEAMRADTEMHRALAALLNSRAVDTA